MSHPDLPAEQAYVDHAYDCLDRMREGVVRALDAAATEFAADSLDAWVVRRMQTFDDADRGLCFGRLDVEGTTEPLYVGRRWVHDDGHAVLVVNWQAPAARPFYTATPDEPHGVTLRRRFRTQGRKLVDLSDEALDGSLEGALGTVDDFLLEELERSRESYMRDIVATIQADQYRLIARDPHPPLVIQGGPGTGKTAVGLHRASFLLYSHRGELGRVLVVGPNPTFMDYVSHVLPALGEDAVDQRAVAELVEGVEVSRSEPLEVARLKADVRLAEVVRRAVEVRSEPHPEELVVRMEGAFVGPREHEVAAILEEMRASDGLSAAARERFRMEVLRRFYRDYGERLGGLATRSFDEVERALRRDGRLTRWLDRVWPAPRPDDVVRQLLASRARLEEAAEGILDPDEQALLVRRGRGWTEGDLPLIDESRAILRDGPPAYGHVVVDEAQDLTPMQLRMVAGGSPGRSRSSVTWPRQRGRRVRPLGRAAAVPAGRTGGRAGGAAARVPRAARADGAGAAAARGDRTGRRRADLLSLGRRPAAAGRVGCAPTRGVRGGGSPCRRGRAVGRDRARVAPAGGGGRTTRVAYDETRVPVLTPREAKGLEFDHVVVVEPALIVEEGVDGQGLRELYVALTRPTRSLVVVHARPLPEPLRG